MSADIKLNADAGAYATHRNNKLHKQIFVLHLCAVFVGIAIRYEFV